MNDNILEILIKFGLSKEKAQEAVSEMKKIEDQVKTTGKEGVKAEEEVQKATKQTFTSKKELKEMVKQLGTEFPLLGAAGRLALNPIVAFTTAITGAFQLWKLRTDELVKSLGGVALPDVTEDAITRAERMAEAYGRVAKALDGVKNAKDAADKMIELANAFNVSAGLTKPSDVAKAKADVARAAGSDAAALAAASLASAGNINPANTAGLEEMRKMAEAAQAQIPEVQARMDYINKARSRRPMFGLNPMRMWESMILGPRYGGEQNYDVMMGMEQERLSGLQDTVSRYTNMREDRARRSELLARGRESASTAADFFGQAATNMGQVAGAAGADFKSIVQNMDSIDPLSLARAIMNLARVIQEGQKATDQAISDQQRANNIRAQRQ